MLSIDVSFVSKFLWKSDKNFENQTSGPIYMEDPVWMTKNKFKSASYLITSRAVDKYMPRATS